MVQPLGGSHYPLKDMNNQDYIVALAVGAPLEIPGWFRRKYEEEVEVEIPAPEGEVGTVKGRKKRKEAKSHAGDADVPSEVSRRAIGPSVTKKVRLVISEEELFFRWRLYFARQMFDRLES